MTILARLRLHVHLETTSKNSCLRHWLAICYYILVPEELELMICEDTEGAEDLLDSQPVSIQLLMLDNDISMWLI